jgi:signal transduction histidine kinase
MTGSMKTTNLKSRVAYLLVALLCLLLSLAAGSTTYATRINHNFYDLYFRQRGPLHTAGDIVIVAIDDATLARYGALPLNRSLLARAIRAIKEGQPAMIAIDLLLTDVSTPDADRDLEQALAAAPRQRQVLLATALEARSGDHWLKPLPGFASAAGAIGHVHADPDADGVSRQVLLEKRAGRERYWALALECVRMEYGLNATPPPPITEMEDTLEIPAVGKLGPISLPAPRTPGRPMLINYLGPEGTFPEISFARFLDGAVSRDELIGKIVILGVTAQGTGDRLFTPFSNGAGMPGVEIHANILETLKWMGFLLPAHNMSVALAVFLIAAATAVVLATFHGPVLIATLAGMGAAILGGPYGLFLKGQVWPAFSLLLPFVTTLVVCGTYQLLSARGKFAESESRRRRSQQQFEMATHEIRTPLAAIQASSELLNRYPLDEAKRRQMVELIYDESQRLGKLVERFLSIERLSAGEIELRRVPVNLAAIVGATIERLQAAAGRKRIVLLREDAIADAPIDGDPELLEFAISNLVTNAVKYSPAGTEVKLLLERDEEHVAVHVTDQGPGMNAEQSRKLFDRFYRTEEAERSGVPGFGLGLAIAREIARHHGGDLSLDTRPGEGSRFTISLPARAPAGRPKQTAR